jgi:hypothetical protein
VPGAEEAELLLSLDDGRHWTVRVSPQLDAHERRWVWRVPALAASEARIALRAGTARDERIVAITAPFRMVPSPTTARPAAIGGERATSMIVEGSLWTGFSPAAGPLATSLASDAPRYEDASASSPAEPPAPGQVQLMPRRAWTPLSPERNATRPQHAVRASAPLEVPLRV